MSAPGSVVFVVDDDPSVRDALRRLITSVGLTVEVFPTAQAFLSSPGAMPRAVSYLTCASPG
jgi:FixJ family two-component response regulator